MATRSIIAKRNEDDSYTAIYCHFDGYNRDEGVGPSLRKWISTPDLVDELLQLGDISCIDYKDGSIIAYHRDRGEKLKITECICEAELKQFAKRSGAEYLYMFKVNGWTVRRL